MNIRILLLVSFITLCVGDDSTSWSKSPETAPAVRKKTFSHGSSGTAPASPIAEPWTSVSEVSGLTRGMKGLRFSTEVTNFDEVAEAYSSEFDGYPLTSKDPRHESVSSYSNAPVSECLCAGISGRCLDTPSLSTNDPSTEAIGEASAIGVTAVGESVTSRTSSKARSKGISTRISSHILRTYVAPLLLLGKRLHDFITSVRVALITGDAGDVAFEDRVNLVYNLLQKIFLKVSQIRSSSSELGLNHPDLGSDWTVMSIFAIHAESKLILEHWGPPIPSPTIYLRMLMEPLEELLSLFDLLED